MAWDTLENEKTEFKEKQILSKYIKEDRQLKCNLLKIESNILTIDDAGVDEMNTLLQFCKYMKDKGLYEELAFTKSGGICKKSFMRTKKGYMLSHGKSMISLVIYGVTGIYRFQFRNPLQKGECGGYKSFQKFRQLCKDNGVNIFDLAIDNGKEVKQTIPKARIDVDESIIGKTIENVHHIDIHSAHMAGVAKAFPELAPAVQYCYDHRKKSPSYKSILTHTWGYLESVWIDYKFAHISKAGIEYTNAIVDKLTDILKVTGRKVLMHNTDGIWYQGEIYHGEGEGNLLGEWSNDWHDCKFRAKSVGIYEVYGYKGDSTTKEYKPVYRGVSSYENTVPRDQWTWGDIYKAGTPLAYRFDRNNMIIIKEEEKDD